MRPPSGSSKPAISRRVVVLPEPDGPSSVKNSPGVHVQVHPVHGGHVAVAFGQVGQTDVRAVSRQGVTVPRASSMLIAKGKSLYGM